MKAVLTAIRSDLRQRKLPALVIGFVILLSCGAGTLALNLLVESDAPYQNAFDQARGAHLTITYNAAQVSASRLHATGAAHGVTATAGPWPQVVGLYSAGSARSGGTQMGGLFIEGRHSPGGSVDRLTIEAGRWPRSLGEVDIARSLADSWGIGPGDQLTSGPGARLPSLQIVGIAASISPYTDAWVVPAEIDRMLSPRTQLQYQMLYRVSPAGSAGDLQVAAQAITAGLPAGAVAHTSNYLDAKRGADTLSSVMVPFLLAFSVFALLASLMIIANVVSGVIIAGYRDIGILKAVGFTPSQVVIVLLSIVLVPTLAGSLLGIPLGTLASQPFLQQTAHALGLPAPFTAAIPVDVLVLVTTLAMATLAALIPAWRAGRLSAIAAITTGTAPAVGRGARGTAMVGRLPVPRPISLGLATVFVRPLRSAMTTGAIVLGVATVIFALSLHLSLGQVAAHLIRDRYVQVVIQRPPPNQPEISKVGPAAVQPQASLSDRSIGTILRSNPDTERYVAETDVPVSLPGIAAPIRYFAYRGPSAWVGYALVVGRWFNGRGEVVAPSKLVTEAHLRVGQTFTAQLHDTPVRLRLVGEILDQTNDNLLLRGDWSTLAAADPRAEPDSYEVNVRAGVDPRSYVDGLSQLRANQGPGGIDARIVERSSANTSFILLNTVIAGLALMLIAIAVAGVFNTILLTTREQVRDLAILKAVGMAPLQVVVAIVSPVVLLGLLAGVLGIPIGLELHAQVLALMAQAASDSKIPPAFFDLINHAVLPPLLLAGAGIAAGGAWLPAQWAASRGVADVLQSE